MLQGDKGRHVGAKHLYRCPMLTIVSVDDQVAQRLQDVRSGWAGRLKSILARLFRVVGRQVGL